MKLQLSPTSSSTTSLLRDSRGLSTVEYIILLVLLAVGCISLWTTLGETVKAKITYSNDEIGKMGQSENSY